MSLNAALSVARSGLTVSSRAAELTSQNVAGALTEGFGRREVDTASRAGVVRTVDQSLMGERRLADAATGASRHVSDFHAGLEKAIGAPGAAGSLSSVVSTLETALIDAASRPDAAVRLDALASAARAVTGRVSDISAHVQTARQDAETGIAAAVTQINAALKQLDGLNGSIAGDMAAGRDVSALQDKRQQLIDGIADHIPLREVDRGNGRIALMTRDGATLLDGRAAELGFRRAGVIAPEMTVESGALHGLTLDGRALPVSGPAGAGGGALAAAFAVRDGLAPAAQAELGAFAAELEARFADTPLFGDVSDLRGDGAALNGLLSAFSGLGGKAADVLSATATRRVSADAAASHDAARGGSLRAAELQGGVDTDQEMQKLLLIERSYAANAKVIQTVDSMMQVLLGI